MEDGSSVSIKAAQYFVNKKHQDLQSAKLNIDGSALMQNLLGLGKERASGADEPTQLPPFTPSANGHVPWVDVLKAFRTKWYKEQTEWKESDRRWDENGFPRFSESTRYRVAIIGAGVAGLRTAMLLQHMNIPYKIFEASDRAGGRVFTYRFPSKPPNNLPVSHDYYDIGAMRFPDNKANEETFKLFEELNLSGSLIRYVMSNDDNIIYYNGIKNTVKGVRSNEDHFHDRGFVPEEYLKKEYTDSRGRKSFGVNACAAAAYDQFREALIADFETGWEQLMKYDWASTRSYLAREMDPKYPLSVVHWMETRNSGTGGFDGAFSQAILDSLEFDDPTRVVNWHCLEGGGEVLIKAMLAKLTTQPSYNHRVTSIEMDPRQIYPPLMRVNVSGKQEEYFTHVVSTASFANLRTINTDEVPITYKQRQAIRTLDYGPAVKVGIKFKTRWWEQGGMKQFGGASYTDRQSRTVVYPSYGLGEQGPGVLIVSYNWGQDASRFGALIEKSDWSKQPDPDRQPPPSEKVLLEQIYEDLATLHGVTVEHLRSETLDYHAFNWYHNPFTMGASVHLAPGQYSTFFADIVQPACYGGFHFAGEVASHHHAWVAGALDSAKRVVTEILRRDFSFIIPKFRQDFGRSLVFDDEKRSEEEFLSGLFSMELEKAGF